MNNRKTFENVMMKISASNFEEKEEIKKPRRTLLKAVAVFCLGIISITGITKAGEIGTFIKDVFEERTYTEGVSTAINNGYISILEPNYKKTKDGIEMAVNSFLVDDFTICLAFTVKVPDKYIEDTDNVCLSFEKVTIKDEKGNKIYSTGDGLLFPNYLYLYNNEVKKSGYRTYSKHIEDNKYILCMEIKGQFPKSKVLRVSAKNIVINLNRTNEKVFKGNLNYKLEVPNEMYEKRAIEYKVASCNDDTTKVETAILSKTEFIIQYTTTRDIINGTEYITTSDGRKVGASDGDYGSCLPTTEGPIRRTAPYVLTIFDATDVITYHIPTTDGEEILIELKR